MIRLIIFDFDGVLCPLNYDLMMEVYNYIAQEMNLSVVWGKTVKEFKDWFSPKYPYNLERMGGGGQEQIRQAEHLFREYLNHHGYNLFPEIEPILTSLRSDFRFAILSNGPEVRAKQQLKEMRNWFSCIVGKETLDGKFKPDSYGVHLCMKHAQVTPEETVIIGDDPSDVLAGIHANLKYTLGASWGMGEEKSLREAGANYILSNVQELYRLPNLFKKMESLF